MVNCLVYRIMEEKQTDGEDRLVILIGKVTRRAPDYL